MTVDQKIEFLARCAHEANRAYCQSLGDTSQLPWEDAPDWQKSSCRNGVLGVLLGNSAEESHKSWLEEKKKTGWVYGPIKNVDTKEHPCMVSYDRLPKEQQVKDHIFCAIVNSLMSCI